LAVLKLNGGLGTTMGCIGPKSAIEVRDNMTFLDLTVRQIEHLNTSNGDIDVPLILMNSFNTDTKTRTILQKYSRHKVSIVTFNQSRYPRINSETLMPVPGQALNGCKSSTPIGRYRRASSPNSVDSASSLADLDEQSGWYPPGHGDLYSSLDQSGLLNDLLANGKDILFISNIDNLGATVDTNILDYMLSEDIHFVMEVTDKTRNDIKGGTLIEYEGQMKLLEIAQVPPEHIKDFTSVKKFKIFNTNNIWVNLRALRKLLDGKSLSLEVIENIKVNAYTVFL
jgi:UTP--glucose-1-phosphate uridylyltransferase